MDGPLAESAPVTNPMTTRTLAIRPGLAQQNNLSIAPSWMYICLLNLKLQHAGHFQDEGEHHEPTDFQTGDDRPYAVRDSSAGRFIASLRAISPRHSSGCQRDRFTFQRWHRRRQYALHCRAAGR